MTRNLAFAIILLMVSSTVTSALQVKNEKSSSSSPFLYDPDAENGGFAHANPPSNAVLDALLASPEVKDTIEDMSDNKMDVAREALRGLFEAVPIDLGGTGVKGDVVVGSFPMSGGDCYWFWIVRTSPEPAKVVLYAIGHSLKLERKRPNGYRNIRMASGTPAQPEEDIFQYDGLAAYRLLRTRLRRVKQ